MSSHDDFVSVGIDMSLLQWDRLGKNIEASTHEVNIENCMISYDAEDSFVEVAGLWR